MRITTKHDLGEKVICVRQRSNDLMMFSGKIDRIYVDNDGIWYMMAHDLQRTRVPEIRVFKTKEMAIMYMRSHFHLFKERVTIIDEDKVDCKVY